jgi:hypothetical protein
MIDFDIFKLENCRAEELFGEGAVVSLNDISLTL